MTPQQLEEALWRRVAQDLGIEFICPFTLRDAEETLSYVGLVPRFGSTLGTAIITEDDLDKQGRLCRVAREQGYGYSCMETDSDEYDRDSFIEILCEWEWISSEPAPSWYTPPPESDTET